MCKIAQFLDIVFPRYIFFKFCTISIEKRLNFEKIISLVFENHLIEEQGLLIIEHATYTKMDHLNYLSFQKKYGGSIFSFFEITITP